MGTEKKIVTKKTKTRKSKHNEVSCCIFFIYVCVLFVVLE